MGTRHAGAVAVAAVIAVAVCVGFVREFSGDFHWHVVLGSELLDHGRLYTRDYHSYTATGQPMFNTSWLSDVALAAAFRAGGMAGAQALRALALVALCACLIVEARRRGVALSSAALLALFVLATGTFTFYLRPETFAFALLAGLLAALGAHERTRRPRYLGIAALLVLAWPNVHGSVGIAVMVVGAYSAQWILEQWLARRTAVDRNAVAAAVAMTPVAFGLACVNPHGVWLPLAFARVQPLHTDTVREYLPITLGTISPLLLLALLVVVATTAATWWLARRPSLWLVAATLVLVYFAHRYQRFSTYAVIAAAPLVAGNFAALRDSLADGARAARWRWTGRVLAVTAAVWFCVVLAFERGLFREIGTELDPDASVFAPDACEFLRDLDAPGPVFNSYDLGNHLMFCLGADYPVAIDQRAQSLYSEAFYRRYRDAAASPRAFRAFTVDFPATWAVVDRDPFAAVIAADPERWTLIYFDDRAQVFARRADPRTAAAIEAHGFRLLGPQRLGRLTELPPPAVPDARAELARQIERCPDCARTDHMRAAVAIAAADDDAFAAAMARLLAAGETVEVAFLGARHALARGDFDTAAVLFQRFRGLGGDGITPALATARAHARRGDVDRALAVLDAAAQDMPDARPVLARARDEIVRATAPRR